LKLGKLIQKQLKDVRVVYTRKTDQFIELYRRGQIANQAGGKLFISIHCNAAPRKPHPANGFEIYLLRPGKTENALRIAERENEVVKLEEGYEQRYQQLTEENYILLTMAQNAYVRYSETLADLLQKEMGQRLGLANNGVKQAGFYVLVGASMPNVLVETAYLSNKHDEKILKNPKAQEKIAQSILSGIRRFKVEYEKSLQEGKEIGAR
jgi:N-acetylmuramoyl-L-alanine amidase